MKLHTETQKYHRIEAFLLLGLFFILSCIFCLKLVFHSHEQPPYMLLVGGLALLATLVFMYYLLALRMDLSISQRTIKYKYRLYPFFFEKKKIRWEDVDHAKVIETSFGSSLSGFDVNFNLMEKRISLNGANGLEIELKNGNHIFLGSQNLSSLKSALQQLGSEKIR